MTILEQLQSIEIKDIKQAYIGKPNMCMCGCSGTYYEPETNFDKVKRILRKIQRNDLNMEYIDSSLGEHIFLVVIGKTQYTIYVPKTNDAKKEDLIKRIERQKEMVTEEKEQLKATESHLRSMQAKLDSWA